MVLSFCMRRICSNKYSAVVFDCFKTFLNALNIKIKANSVDLTKHIQGNSSMMKLL